LTFSVRSFEPSVDRAYEVNTESTNRIVALAEKYKIEKALVQTSDIDVDPQFPSGSIFVNANKITGYVVTRRISMELHNVNSFSALIRDVLKNGATGIEGYYPDSSERLEAKERARSLALQAAHDKAESLAKASGCTLGRPLRIVENVEPGFASRGKFGYYGARNAIEESPGSGENSSGLALGRISVQARITATYELK
jgi:uncharacterized protein